MVQSVDLQGAWLPIGLDLELGRRDTLVLRAIAKTKRGLVGYVHFGDTMVTVLVLVDWIAVTEPNVRVAPPSITPEPDITASRVDFMDWVV